MNNQTKIIIIIALFLTAGISIYLFTRKDKTQVEAETEAQEQQEQPPFHEGGNDTHTIIQATDLPTSYNTAWISYLNSDLELPRGIRNNNPLNIRKTGIKWNGEIPESERTDTGYEQFEAYIYGIRAGIKDIYGDIARDGTNTLRKLLHEFAPTIENNTDAYIEAAELNTGFDADQTLTPDRKTIRKLIKAFAHHENGIEAITNAQFNQAWAIAEIPT